MAATEPVSPQGNSLINSPQRPSPIKTGSFTRTSTSAFDSKKLFNKPLTNSSLGKIK
jgi:hypothetical protein